MELDIDKFLTDWVLETFATQKFIIWERTNFWLAVCFFALQ